MVGLLARVNVALIRHGNTAPATPDIARRLTDKGRMQARAAAGSYVLSRLAPIAPLVICSAAGRCVETATIALGEGEAVEGGRSAFKLVSSETLYDGTMQPDGSAAFAKLGYAPLAEYRAESATVRALLDRYADDALDEISSIASTELPPAITGAGRRPTLCVFGHAIYLPSIALLLAQRRGIGDTAAVLETNTAECAGYLVTEGAVELLAT